MQDEHPLLSDYLEELKTFKDGVFLDRTISIFLNDWSLNPDFEDDYSERVSIKTAMLSKLNPKDYQSYRVMWYDQPLFYPNVIEICVRKFKEDKNE